MIPTASPVTDGAAHWPRSLIELLERQQVLVDRLAALARSQAALISERRTDRLLELLAERQSIIDEFTASQQEMGALTEPLEQRLAGLAAPQRDHIRSLVNAIGQRLGEVMQHDQQDQASLRADRDDVRGELQGVGAARAAHSAYGPPASHAVNRFADRRG